MKRKCSKESRLLMALPKQHPEYQPRSCAGSVGHTWGLHPLPAALPPLWVHRAGPGRESEPLLPG